MTALRQPHVSEISDLGQAPPPRPLILDLDGTLVRADMLLETVLALLRSAPWRLFEVGMWMLRGRAYLYSATVTEAATTTTVPAITIVIPPNRAANAA